MVPLLDIRYALFEFAQRHGETAPIGSVASLEEKRVVQKRAELEWVRSALVQFPYWTKGHLVFAAAALELDDIAAAYAAAQAVITLAPTGHYAYAAKMLLGRCYLRRGAASEALKIFRDVPDSVRTDVRLLEDMAACHMALGEYEDVISLLSSIRPEKISMEGGAALAHARAKVSGKLPPPQ